MFLELIAQDCSVKVRKPQVHNLSALRYLMGVSGPSHWLYNDIYTNGIDIYKSDLDIDKLDRYLAKSVSVL